jgi:hypothetical protein
MMVDRKSTPGRTLEAGPKSGWNQTRFTIGCPRQARTNARIGLRPKPKLQPLSPKQHRAPRERVARRRRLRGPRLLRPGGPRRSQDRESHFGMSRFAGHWLSPEARGRRSPAVLLGVEKPPSSPLPSTPVRGKVNPALVTGRFDRRSRMERPTSLDIGTRLRVRHSLRPLTSAVRIFTVSLWGCTSVVASTTRKVMRKVKKPRENGHLVALRLQFWRVSNARFSRRRASSAGGAHPGKPLLLQ